MRHDIGLRALVAAPLIAAACPALADSIDGKWCAPDGRRIEIIGSTGKWGKGIAVTGDYRRYTFAFDMPPGEPEAGQRVEMRFLRGEPSLRVEIGGAAATIWRVCQAEIS